MADTGWISPGELTPSMLGGSNGGQSRISDGDNSTYTEAYDFSGGTETFYCHSFSGTDIPAGSNINGVELRIAGNYEPDYTAFNLYMGIAKDGDGTDGNASSATFSDVANGGTGYTGTSQLDNGGGSITGDGGFAAWDIPNDDSGTEITFGSPSTTWQLDWGTAGLDLTNLVVKLVIAYDISSGIWIFQFRELALKIHYTPPPVARMKINGGSVTLKAGSLKIM